MRRQRLVLGLFASWVVFAPALALAISPGQTANFQDGTIQGWTNGNASVPLPVTITDGGPAGVGDHYLQVSSGSIGTDAFPGHLVTFNRTTFAGDYGAAGVSAISMDLKNFSPPDDFSQVVPTLPMRFTVENGFGSAPAYISDSVDLPSDGAWHHVVFLFSTDMHAFGTFNSLAQVLAAVGESRILAANSPSLQGDSGNYRFGVDNIQAITRGDWNRDGSVTAADIPAMLAGLADLKAYEATKSVDDKTLLAIGDFDSSGAVTNGDIQPLLDLVAANGGGSIAAVPEPAAFVSMIWAVAVLSWIAMRRLSAARI